MIKFTSLSSSSILHNEISCLPPDPEIRVLDFGRMKNPDMATTVARQRGLAKAAAADQLDRAIHQIIKALRHGRPAHLPGLGTIEPGKPWTFRPDPAVIGKPAVKTRPGTSR